MAKYNTGIRAAEFKEGELKAFEVGGRRILITLKDGALYALDDKCTHEGGSLSEGYIDGCEVICPLHAAAFDIKTGKANENTHWATDTRSYAAYADASSGEVFIEV
jgi:nitrite reductase/ring-hydroxylating ferredoxin subunit